MKLAFLTLFVCAGLSAQISESTGGGHGGGGSAGNNPSNFVSGSGTTQTVDVSALNLDTTTFKQALTGCKTATGVVAITGIALTGTAPITAVAFTYTNTAGVSCTVNANSGPGATGAQGAKGDTGDTGLTGPQGVKGDTGDTGPPGTGGGGSSAYTTVTFSTTPVFVVTASTTVQNFLITLTNSVSSSTLTTTNATAGQDITFKICQDSTGSRAFVWPTNVTGQSTVDPTLSTCSIQSFRFDGTNANAINTMTVIGGSGDAVVMAGSTSGSVMFKPAAAAGTGSVFTAVPGASVSVIGDAGSSNNFLTGIDPITGVVTKAQPTDANLSTSDITTNNASTSKHGFVPKLPNDATKYLNGVGGYTVPASSGGSGPSVATGYNGGVVVGNSDNTLCTLTVPANTLLAGGAANSKKVGVQIWGKNNSGSNNINWKIKWGTDEINLFGTAIGGGGKVWGTWVLQNNLGVTNDQTMVLFTGDAGITAGNATAWEPPSHQDTTGSKVLSVTAATDAGTDQINMFVCNIAVQ